MIFDIIKFIMKPILYVIHYIKKPFIIKKIKKINDKCCSFTITTKYAYRINHYIHFYGKRKKMPYTIQQKNFDNNEPIFDEFNIPLFDFVKIILGNTNEFNKVYKINNDTFPPTLELVK